MPLVSITRFRAPAIWFVPMSMHHVRKRPEFPSIR